MASVEEVVNLVVEEVEVAVAIHQPLDVHLPRFGPALELLILALIHLQVEVDRHAQSILQQRLAQRLVTPFSV
jgi:NADH:ubiquinone oxidoreductase subunit B-like Fe-S oxidoreductase